MKIYQIGSCSDGNDDVDGKLVYEFDFGQGRKYSVVAASQEEADARLEKLLSVGRVKWAGLSCEKNMRPLSKRKILAEECVQAVADLREAGVDVEAIPVEIEVKP